jgi:hypothetical protein
LPDAPHTPSRALSELRDRIYEDEELAITKWTMRAGEQPMYQITSKDEAKKRSGDGFLLLSAAAMQRMCRALGDVIW